MGACKSKSAVDLQAKRESGLAGQGRKCEEPLQLSLSPSSVDTVVKLEQMEEEILPSSRSSSELESAGLEASIPAEEGSVKLHPDDDRSSNIFVFVIYKMLKFPVRTAAVDFHPAASFPKKTDSPSKQLPAADLQQQREFLIFPTTCGVRPTSIEIRAASLTRVAFSLGRQRVSIHGAVLEEATRAIMVFRESDLSDARPVKCLRICVVIAEEPACPLSTVAGSDFCVCIAWLTLLALADGATSESEKQRKRYLCSSCRHEGTDYKMSPRLPTLLSRYHLFDLCVTEVG